MIAVFLILAGLAKIKSGRKGFFRDILGYAILPDSIAWLVATLLPIVEIILGVMLFVGLLAPVVSLFAALLLLVFSAAILYSLLRGRDIDCGCFGTLRKKERVQWNLVYRNYFLIALCFANVIFMGGTFTLDTLIGTNTLTHSFINFGYPLIGVWTIGLVPLAALYFHARAHQPSIQDRTPNN